MILVRRIRRGAVHKVPGLKITVVQGVCNLHKKRQSHIKTIQGELVSFPVFVSHFMFKVVSCVRYCLEFTHDIVNIDDQLLIFLVAIRRELSLFITEQVKKSPCGRDGIKFVFSVRVFQGISRIHLPRFGYVVLIEIVHIFKIGIEIQHQEGIHHDTVIIGPTPFFLL